jgi:hypothetical protein
MRVRKKKRIIGWRRRRRLKSIFGALRANELEIRAESQSMSTFTEAEARSKAKRLVYDDDGSIIGRELLIKAHSMHHIGSGVKAEKVRTQIPGRAMINPKALADIFTRLYAGDVR